MLYTVWKLHDFSVTQILREINYEEPIISKTTIFANFVAVNVVNLAVIEMRKSMIFSATQILREFNFEVQDFLINKTIKSISLKIGLEEKFASITTLCVSNFSQRGKNNLTLLVY